MFEKFLDSLSVQETQFFNWFILFVLVFVSLIVGLPALIKVIQRWRLKRKIQNLGTDSIHYVNIPDGLGGRLFYEHVILRQDGIAIYSLARYRGNIFAADKIDVWAQVENNRSYKFPNPLMELESKKVALKAQLPEIPVLPGILVAHNVNFPKGKPENVHLLNTLPAATTDVVNPVYLEAWNKLKNMAQPLSENERNVYLDNEENSTYWGQFIFSGLFLLLAFAWFYFTSLTN